MYTIPKSYLSALVKIISFCQNFIKFWFKELFLTIVTYLQVRPSCVREAVAMATFLSSSVMCFSLHYIRLMLVSKDFS